MEIAIYTPSTQTLLRDELHILGRRLQVREDDERVAAAEAILSGNDSDAETYFQRIREIANIRETVMSFLVPTKSTAIEPISNAISPPVVPFGVVLSSHGLGVTIGGTRILGYSDAAVFANAIHELGCEKVMELGLTMNYLPLVSKELHKLVHQRYSMQTERRGEWFIVTHSNAQRKRELLAQICRRLGLSLKVERSLN